jgi:16S rRNA (guanine1207-N2)-methyltransferase
MSTDVTSITEQLLGNALAFVAAPGLFSAHRVDDGTRLLLDHLPKQAPASVLDLGCGYGALGLPIAAAFPEATVVLVDRDLLAVETSRQNAARNGLGNATCLGSLGYRDVPDGTFDWVLCNVPARIGANAIAYILSAGAARLGATGDLRVVVIRDLDPIVERLASERRWPIERVASSARHSVYRTTGPLPGDIDHESIYLRDKVKLPVELERPHDISEDQDHLISGVPLLMEFLPRKTSGNALVWRGGYGAAAVALAQRGAIVTAADKDLLATTFTRRNAARLGVPVVTRDVLSPAELAPAERFDTLVGELAPPAGEETTVREITAVVARATPRSTLLWLGMTKLTAVWLEVSRTGQRWTASKLGSRGTYSVLRIRPVS